MPPEEDEPMEMKVVREEVARKVEEGASGRGERSYRQGPRVEFRVNVGDSGGGKGAAKAESKKEGGDKK